MRAPEPIPGLRVVAAPAVLDSVVWSAEVPALRLASDDLLAIGAGHLDIDDALIEDEQGFVGWWLSPYPIFCSTVRCGNNAYS